MQTAQHRSPEAPLLCLAGTRPSIFPQKGESPSTLARCRNECRDAARLANLAMITNLSTVRYSINTSSTLRKHHRQLQGIALSHCILGAGIILVDPCCLGYTAYRRHRGRRRRLRSRRQLPPPSPRQRLCRGRRWRLQLTPRSRSSRHLARAALQVLRFAHGGGA